MIIQLLFVLTCIIVGARLGGIGLGVMGGLGMAILTFFFNLQPTSPPIDVMLMILSVITAAACMQAAGGLDYLVRLAEKLLRKHPTYITYLSPFVTYLFTFIAGTGHVAYSVLPVIAEVATETKIRPERPLGIAVIASQQAITASPISAATVALLAMLTPYHISLFDILKITIPATLIGVLAGAIYSLRVGKELHEDPEYLARVKAGLIDTSPSVFTETKSRESQILRIAFSDSDYTHCTIRFVQFPSSQLYGRRRAYQSGNAAHYRNCNAYRGGLDSSPYPYQWAGSLQGERILGRDASRYCHIRYCLDGRYLYQWELANPDGLYGANHSTNAFFIWTGTFHHVHLII